jgi:hypothetical protein
MATNIHVTVAPHGIIWFIIWSKILSLERKNKKNRFLFCSLLTYSYLCTRFAGMARRRLNRETNTIPNL